MSHPRGLGEVRRAKSELRGVVYSLASGPAHHLHSVNQLKILKQEVGSQWAGSKGACTLKQEKKELFGPLSGSGSQFQRAEGKDGTVLESGHPGPEKARPDCGQE